MFSVCKLLVQLCPHRILPLLSLKKPRQISAKLFSIKYIILDHMKDQMIRHARLYTVIIYFSLILLRQAKFNPSQESGSRQEHTVPVSQPSEPTDQEPRQEPRQESEGNTGSDSRTQQQTPPAASQKSLFDDFDDNLIPGLDLFQQGQSYNPDEEAFIRRMKRQHRRGRKH